MDPKSRSTRGWSAGLLATAAVYFGIHLWFLLSALFTLDNSSRSMFWDQVRESITYWFVFVVAGIALAFFAMRFNILSIGAQRTVLAVCVVTGVTAGLVAEWWTSLYFFFPVVFLALSHRRAVHA
jgi:hypothetical protein